MYWYKNDMQYMAGKQRCNGLLVTVYWDKDDIKIIYWDVVDMMMLFWSYK